MSYEDMDAQELRAELEDWHHRIAKLARDYRAARQAGDWAWEAGVGLALDQALAQARRIERYLQLGVAA